jgi:hypothetical protein
MAVGESPCGHPALSYGGGCWECAVCHGHVDPHDLA